jgi:divalent metal cation (Fe/Co/Zn/Cd) transporter
MSDKNVEKPAVKTGQIESLEAGQTTSSSRPGGRLQAKTPVSQAKRWHFRSGYVLILVGAIGVALYLLRSRLAQQYEGLGAALCAIACAGFLIWHVIHLLVEQDQLEEQAEALAPETNPVEPPTN